MRSDNRLPCIYCEFGEPIHIEGLSITGEPECMEYKKTHIEKGCIVREECLSGHREYNGFYEEVRFVPHVRVSETYPINFCPMCGRELK